VVVGVKHDLSDCSRLSLDVAWYNWSSSFSGLDLRLTNPSNPLVGALLGPAIRDRIPLSWKDGVSVRTGYEYFLTPCDTLRAGYIYDSPAAATPTLTPYIPGIVDHTFTLGYGRKVGNVALDIAYQYSFGPKKSLVQSALAGGTFDNSELRAQAHFLIVSFRYNF
jgi:long-subunit fatty acid transport protein